MSSVASAVVVGSYVAGELFGPGDPPSADPAVGQAAKENAAVAREQLAFSKTVYEENKPRQAKMDALAEQVVNQQLELGAQSAELSQDYTDYMKGTFRPIEQALAGESATAGGVADQERLAGQAGVDVSTNFEAGREAQKRDLGRVGTNPNSGAYLSADTSSRVMEAATRAQAMNNARENAKNIGWAKKMDVANVGRNLPSSQATSAGLALNANSAAVNTAAVPMSTANQNAAQMNAGYAGAVNANTASGNLYLGQYGANLQSYNAKNQAEADKWSGVGQLATTAYMMSSKKVKENKRAVDPEIVLKGLKKLPVEKWDYKKGVADDGTHIGAYAEDFKKEFGTGGDGKSISVVDAIGVSMAAIKGLSKQVDRIERNMKPEARHGN